MKKFFYPLVLAACLFVPACSGAETTGSRMVTHVTDGDTLVLDNHEKVRLIGIDTPEIHDDDHRNAAHAVRYHRDPKLVDEFALKARDFADKTILGQKVRLEYDWERQDKYGRTLAYVYRESDNLFLNAEVLKKGYGFAYTRFPFKYKDEFKGYEAEARRNREGLWQ